jgi:hypothetical protein
MVVQRECNHSAFNGWKYTPSKYSEVRCVMCGRSFRTKAAYVALLPDAPDKWWNWSTRRLMAWRRKYQTERASK